MYHDALKKGTNNCLGSYERLVLESHSAIWLGITIT